MTSHDPEDDLGTFRAPSADRPAGTDQPRHARDDDTDRNPAASANPDPREGNTTVC